MGRPGSAPEARGPGVRSTESSRAVSTAFAQRSGRIGQRSRIWAWRMWRMLAPVARIVRRPCITSAPTDAESYGVPFAAVAMAGY